MKKIRQVISIIATLLAFALILSSCIGKAPPASAPEGTTNTPANEHPVVENPPILSEEQAADSGDDSETPSSEDAQLEVTVPPDEEQLPATMPPEESSFEVHYIDVGQGDCSLIICDGHAMLIDGGEASESSKVYAYLKAHEISYLDYIVATHAHSDHIGGLSGALNYATVGTAYCPVTSYDSKTFDSFVKYLGKQGVSITVPVAGDVFTLGTASVQILGPQRSYDDPNDTSIVLKVTYGETSFLFTGDAERTAEADILEASYDLSATVLKVGHHGSDTSTSYPFLREIMPEYAVIQVGKDNSFGHPAEDTMSRLRDANVKVYRTDMQGDVICTSDGESVSFKVERNAEADTLAIGPNSTQITVDSSPDSTSEPSSNENSGAWTIGSSDSPTGTTYVLNTNTHKFHYQSCSSVNQMKDSNKEYYSGTRNELIEMGYSPCGRCNP